MPTAPECTSPDPIELNQSIKCTHCKRPLSEHDVQEGDILTELGRELSQGSRWMREVATLSLMLVGVPKSQIRVPASARNDPVDLAFSFGGPHYLCELKDDEVTSGDAGNLIARSTALGSPRLMVITTAPLSDGAARVFAETGRGLGKPVILEGDECVTKKLRWEVIFRKLEDFASTIALRGPGNGISIGQLLVIHLFASSRSEEISVDRDSIGA